MARHLWVPIAPTKPRRGGWRVEVETSHCNPVGNQSHPVRASHPPEASLASSSVMAARSVDSECKSRVIEPRNHSSRGSLRGSGSGGNTVSLQWLGEYGPAGVLEQGRCIVGLPRKLGDPVGLHCSELPGWDSRLTKSQAGGWCPLASTRAKYQSGVQRYREAKETELAGRTREVLVP